MKFWKILSPLIEEQLPDWRDKFLSYKELKKQLKLVYPLKERENKRPRLDSDETDGPDEPSKEVVDFLRLLENEIEKFNRFFLDQEEEYVIKWKELRNRVTVTEAESSNEELISVGREIVDFHGEMVLLENYSALNYTGLVKILKKYDKRSGALIRLPFIQKVLHEPFFKTDVINKLVKECEMMLDHFFSVNQPSKSVEATDDKRSTDAQSSNEDEGRTIQVPKELADIENMESMYTKLTVSALRVLKEIRSGSSTVSMFSLPPLQSNAAEPWNNLSVIQQAAK